VRINVADDVAAELVNCFPEVLPLPRLKTVLGQDIGGEVGIGSVARRDLEGAVGRTRVDHRDLVDERVAIHQLAFKNDDLFPYRFLLVEGGDAETDRQTGLALCPHQLLHVPELAVMKRVRLEPSGYSLVGSGHGTKMKNRPRP